MPPYASDAQRKYFHAHAQELARQGVNIHQWDAETKKEHKKLPAHVKPRHQQRKAGK